MKQLTLILLLTISASLFAQTKVEVFQTVQQSIVKSFSTLGKDAKHSITDANLDELTVSIVSKEENTIEKNSIVFDLEFKMFDDFYSIPTADGTTVILSFKEPVISKKSKVEFKNLFHEEIETEDFNESAEIWFNFENETDATEFEKRLSQLKKLLNSN